MRAYTQEQVNEMTEDQVDRLFAEGKIDDDMAQRARDYRDFVYDLYVDACKEFGIMAERR